MQWLLLTEAPRFVRLRQMVRDQHVVQHAGSTVRLRCRVDAVPPASVVWLKDDRLLVPHTAHDGDDGEADDEAGFVLRLWSVTAADSGRYTCQVFNDVGLINFTYTLQVTGTVTGVCLHTVTLYRPILLLFSLGCDVPVCGEGA